MGAFLILPIVVSIISSPVGTYPQIKEIGYYAETCLSENQRIYLETAEERDMIAKLGLSINAEIINTGHSVTTRYYYNVSQYSGKILEARQIRNDMDSFAYLIGKLETIDQYELYIGYGVKNSVLGYIRSLNKRYCTDYTSDFGFNLVCGDINTLYNNYVDNDFLHFGVKYNDYFGSFVNPSDLNYSGHKDASFNLHDNYLVDPMDHSKTIDMTHFVTVMDGVYNGTDGKVFGSETSKDLISWAGDLQDAVNKHRREYDNFPSMLFASSPKSACSYDDFVADIDGFAIGSRLDNTKTIEQTIRDYYRLIELDGNNYRYSSFIGALGYEYDHDYNNLVSDFEKRVFDMLAMDLHDDGSVTSNDSPFYKYYILTRKEGLPGLSYRYKIGKSFVDYVLEKANMYEEIILDEAKVI
jgi:hypothetical protein